MREYRRKTRLCNVKDKSKGRNIPENLDTNNETYSEPNLLLGEKLSGETHSFLHVVFTAAKKHSR